MRYSLSMKLLMVGGVVISTLSSTQLFSAKPAKLAGPLVTIISDTDQAKLEKTRTKLQKVARPVWASARKNGALLSSQYPVEDEMAVESLLSRLKALEVLTKQQENKNKILENNVIRLQHELTMATASITAGASESLSEGEGSEKQSLSDVSRRSSVPNSQVGESTVSRKIQGVRAQRSTPEELAPSDVEYTKRVAPMSGTKGQVVSTAVAGRSDVAKKETQRSLPVTREIRNVAQKLQPMETGEHVVYREREVPVEVVPVESFRNVESSGMKIQDDFEEPSNVSKVVYAEARGRAVMSGNAQGLVNTGNGNSNSNLHKPVDVDRLVIENELLRSRALGGGAVYVASSPQTEPRRTIEEANAELRKIKSEVSKSVTSLAADSSVSSLRVSETKREGIQSVQNSGKDDSGKNLTESFSDKDEKAGSEPSKGPLSKSFKGLKSTEESASSASIQLPSSSAKKTVSIPVQSPITQGIPQPPKTKRQRGVMPPLPSPLTPEEQAEETRLQRVREESEQQNASSEKAIEGNALMAELQKRNGKTNTKVNTSSLIECQKEIWSRYEYWAKLPPEELMHRKNKSKRKQL